MTGKNARDLRSDDFGYRGAPRATAQTGSGNPGEVTTDSGTSVRDTDPRFFPWSSSELESIRDAYLTAVAQHPNDAAAHHNLACILGQLGQLEAALRHAERAAVLEPGHSGPRIVAGIAAARLGRHGAALAWLDHAQTIEPANVQVLIARAEMLLKLGHAARGLELCQQAVALHPANGEAWLCLGLLRKALHQDNEALEAFDLAASLLSRPATALANRAIVLLELGRREDALLALDHAGKADPDHALTWFLRADTKIFLAGDPDVAAMERALFSGQGAPLCDADQIFLHYAVGKAWLDISDAERAFAHLNQGSRMKRASVNYDAGAAEQAMARIAAAFPAALFSRLGDAGEQSDVPVFIVGMPRSGTTLVEQILASHPRVHAAGEASHIEQLARELGGAWPDGVAALSQERIAELGRRYVAMAAPLGLGMARVTDKLPGNFQRAGLIHLLLPRARIIHCRRDAVDTCLSCYSKLFETGQDFSYDLTELGGYYRSYAALMAHWRAVLPAASFIETNYETIVHDLEGEARRLIAFCGLEWDDACLRFHLSRRVVRTSSKNQVRQPVYRHSVGRWMPFHDELGPLLEALSGPGTSFRET